MLYSCFMFGTILKVKLIFLRDDNVTEPPFTAYSCRVLKNLENDTLLDYMRYKEIKLNDKLILYLISVYLNDFNISFNKVK